MGLLVDGEWRDRWYDTKSTGGRFERQQSAFRSRVTADPDGEFPAEAGRYRLYVSYACPWAHRTLVFRKLKRLEDVLPVSVVHPYMGRDGWTFDAAGDVAGATDDPELGAKRLYEIYRAAKPDYTGRVTVPVLWDRHRKTIVNNESAEIIRMLNSEFDEWGDRAVDFYPEPLRGEIDEVNARVYGDVNNGVYRCGFATTQEAYEEAFGRLFAALDWLEGRLAGAEYLVGGRPTEADWRLFTTLVRFDAVYVGHFKCNLRRIVDYRALSAYLERLYRTPGVSETVHMDHIKQHYYRSHPTINPTGIVPRGPELAFLRR